MNKPNVNVTSNNITTIGQVHDVFVKTFGQVFTCEGNYGKAMGMASKNTRKAVREMIAAQASDPKHAFQAMAAFRQKWATLLGKEPMEFATPEKGRGLQFEPEVATIKRLFAVLLDSTLSNRWREFFKDAMATGYVDADAVMHLFTVLLNSPHSNCWREFFEDAVATERINEGKVISQMQKLGKEHDAKIVPLNTKPAEQMSADELEEKLSAAS